MPRLALVRSPSGPDPWVQDPDRMTRRGAFGLDSPARGRHRKPGPPDFDPRPPATAAAIPTTRFLRLAA